MGNRITKKSLSPRQEDKKSETKVSTIKFEPQPSASASQSQPAPQPESGSQRFRAAWMARPELRTLVVTGMTKQFRLDKMLDVSGEDHRVVLNVPEAFNDFVKKGDKLWAIRYRRKSRF